jgi:hydroxymethylglutaryl-CoA lyase
MGVTQISLADTVGLATPELVEEVMVKVIRADVAAEIGVHLHARPEGAGDKIAAAYRAGCHRFDTALAGVGGCPFAQDALVGNVATETAIATLQSLGADLPPLRSLDKLLQAAHGIAARFGQPAMVH